MHNATWTGTRPHPDCVPRLPRRPMDAEKRPFCPLTASARPKLIVLDGPFCTLFYAQLTIEHNHDRLP
jgi:hypothetical protein